ncbi:MAG TPA: 5,6-dimethylbenzimidazole synthase [Devosia sp.]|jgi:5,6-dimethylbenzimidazole synthase|nr:5,6-dimethylbenzimidazole synthase [Devosia sp.]
MPALEKPYSLSDRLDGRPPLDGAACRRHIPAVRTRAQTTGRLRATLATEPDASAVPEFGPDFRREFLDLLRWRRDVRRFRTDAIAPETIERLLAIASLAPSVGLSQPWRFVLVDTPGCRAGILENFERCNAEALADYGGDRAALYARLKLSGLREAPCQFAVFADLSTSQGAGLGRRTMPATLEYSAVMAVHTLWLAARAEGIGLGWVSILDPEAVCRLLDAPPDWKLVGYFCMGLPAEASPTPELETRGWETRRLVSILRR